MPTRIMFAKINVTWVLGLCEGSHAKPAPIKQFNLTVLDEMLKATTGSQSANFTFATG